MSRSSSTAFTVFFSFRLRCFVCTRPTFASDLVIKSSVEGARVSIISASNEDDSCLLWTVVGGAENITLSTSPSIVSG